jgi:hypothetical protein
VTWSCQETVEEKQVSATEASSFDHAVEGPVAEGFAVGGPVVSPVLSLVVSPIASPVASPAVGALEPAERLVEVPAGVEGQVFVSFVRMCDGVLPEKNHAASLREEEVDWGLRWCLEGVQAQRKPRFSGY